MSRDSVVSTATHHRLDGPGSIHGGGEGFSLTQDSPDWPSPMRIGASSGVKYPSRVFEHLPPYCAELYLVADHFWCNCFLGLLASVTDGSWHALL